MNYSIVSLHENNFIECTFIDNTSIILVCIVSIMCAIYSAE